MSHQTSQLPRDDQYEISGLKNSFVSLFRLGAVKSGLDEATFLDRNKGIRNTGVDCYLNTALQCLKTVLRQCSIDQRKNVVAHLSSKPQLVSFLRGNLETSIEEHARGLRHDIAVLVECDDGLSEEDRFNINTEGCSTNEADSIDFLRVLSPHLDKSTMRTQIKDRSCRIEGLNPEEAKRLVSLIENNQYIPLPEAPMAARPMLIQLENERGDAAGGRIVDLHLSKTIVTQNIFPTLECDLDHEKPVGDIQSLITATMVQSQKAFFNETLEQACNEKLLQKKTQGLSVPELSDFYF